MDIKAVAFDYGGVIELWAGNKNYTEIGAEMLNVPVNEFREVYYKYNHLSNAQNLPWEDMFMKVISEFSTEKETQEKVMIALKTAQSQNSINTELISWFSVIRNQGLKVAILSNATTDLREKLKKNRILELVDEVVISGEIGHQKPHKEAFQVLFDRLHVPSYEAVFIDDSRRSLEKAEEIGYTPILFTGNDQLKVELKNLGISL